MSTLSGCLALVTGGGSGIGRAVAELFAKEGAEVIVADINEQSAKKTIDSLDGENHMGVKCDVTSAESVSDLFVKIRSTYGDKVPSKVVLCAGIGTKCTIVNLDEKEFDGIVNTSLKGTFLLMKAAARCMIEANTKVGAMVTFSSAAVHMDGPGLGAYSAAKHGVIGLTKVAAKEWASIPIRCNALLPGLIDTPIINSFNTEEDIKRWKIAIPLGRFGCPKEVAEACLFLVSEKSSYITGACIDCNGGLY